MISSVTVRSLRPGFHVCVAVVPIAGSVPVHDSTHHSESYSLPFATPLALNVIVALPIVTVLVCVVVLLKYKVPDSLSTLPPL